MTMLREAAAVAGKDLRIELRGRYALGAVLPFAATLLITFGLSLGPGRGLLLQTAPGLLWLAVLFASVLSFPPRVRGRIRRRRPGGPGLWRRSIVRRSSWGRRRPWRSNCGRSSSRSSCWWPSCSACRSGELRWSCWGHSPLGTIGLAAVGSLFGVLESSPRAREAVFPRARSSRSPFRCCSVG